MNGLPTPYWRRISVAAHVVFAVLLVSAAWMLIFREGKYSGWNYDKIQEGATLGQVEALLGRSHEEVLEGQLPHAPTCSDREPVRYFRWREPGGSGYIAIALNRDGRVCGKIIFQPSW